jgi:hypothetical protein
MAVPPMASGATPPNSCVTQAMAPSRGRHSHSGAIYFSHIFHSYISVVILHTKYTKRRLNECTAHG